METLKSILPAEMEDDGLFMELPAVLRADIAYEQTESLLTQSSIFKVRFRV